VSISLAATPDSAAGLGPAALAGLDPATDLVGEKSDGGGGSGGSGGPALLGVCTAALAHCLWSAAPAPSQASPGSPASSPIRSAAIDGVAALLRALHDRARPDGGGPALDPALFHAPPGALSPSRFLAEVRGGHPTPRAAVVLRLAPFLVPFRDRVAAFMDALADDGGGGGGEDDEWGWSMLGGGPPRPPRFAVIRRTAVLADALASLAPLPPRTLATGRIRIQFIDEHGLEEAGIDGGGLWKECANLLVRAGFSPATTPADDGVCEGGDGGGAGLFAETPGRELYPDPAAVAAAVAASARHGSGLGGSPPPTTSLATYEFLGRLLGRLARDGLASGVPLAPFVVKQLLRRPVGLADLPSLDPALAASLAALRSAPAADVEAAGLSFTASDAAGGEVPLHPGGEARPVTGENVVEFVVRAAHHYLTARLAPAIAALRRGLEATLPPGWAAAFGAAEFAALLGGGGGSGGGGGGGPGGAPSAAPLDLDDMRAHARYGGGYDDAHPAVAAFWEAVAGMSPAEQAAVLRFVTAAGRPPLLGFSRLEPPLPIVPAGGGGGGGGGPGDAARLPTAATCLNLLKLPAYAGGAAEVRAKLLYAAAEAGGFGLS
jgi:ubiquitin-protein ligase E3 C